ncbi:barren [Meredithblackwellia eburnea MCA 4105]
MSAILQQRNPNLPSTLNNNNSTPPRKSSHSSSSLGHGAPPLQQQQHHQQRHHTPKGVAAFAAASRLREHAPGSPRNVSFTAVGHDAAQPGLVVESQRFEEWMKIATDNKITSTNTWNLALIDYFHDMRLLRNGPEDSSINFQKASCTLDGCVKIWTSRVDSVGTETAKLLSGLAEDARAGANSLDDDEDGAGDSDDEDGSKESRRSKKKSSRQTTTLSDTFDKLRVKSFDLEFTVDPLFKKTSADFDEGGAGGILMNHLGCDGRMKVVFDAGDAKLGEEGDGEGEGEDGEGEEEEIDIGRLLVKYLPPSVTTSLPSRSLCPSLAAFRFSPDANLDLDILNPVDDVTPLPHRPQQQQQRDAAVSGGAVGGDDFEAFGDDGNNDFGGGGGDNEDDGGDYGGGAGIGVDGTDDFFSDLNFDSTSHGGPSTSYGNASRGGLGEQSQVTVEMSAYTTNGGGGPGQRSQTSMLFDELDAALEKNWAGPEHWKMRRVVGAAGATGGAGKKGDEAPKARKEKTAFALDFTVPPLTSQKDLFAPASNASSIRNPSPSSNAKGKGKERDEFVLPKDYGFNSAVLLRLFLKPRTTLRMRRRHASDDSYASFNASNILGGADLSGAGGSGGGFEEQHGPEFWAPGGPGMMGGDDDDMGGHDDGGDFDFGGDAIPFNTQFINDDDTPSLEDDEDDDVEGDLMVLTQGQLRKTARIDIGHARKAKRVDVKKLKDTIWKELEEVAVKVPELPTEPVYPRSELSTDPSSTGCKPEALIPVIQGLRRAYPKDKMDEISTSFCFICLLHLANENGLRIQTPDAGERDDGLLPRKAVGGLEGLRVFREIAAF